MVISFAGSAGAGKDTGATVPTQYKAFWVSENGTHHLTADPPYSGLSSADVVVNVTKPLEVYKVPNGMKFGYTDFTNIDINTLNFNNVEDASHLMNYCSGITNEIVNKVIGESKSTSIVRCTGCQWKKESPYIDLRSLKKITSVRGFLEYSNLSKKYITVLLNEGITSIGYMCGGISNNMKNVLDFGEVEAPITDYNSFLHDAYSVHTVKGLTLTYLQKDNLYKDSLYAIYLNGSLSISYNIPRVMPMDSIKSVLTAASKATNNDAKTLSFPTGTTVTDTDGTFADLVAQCTAKGWTVTNLTTVEGIVNLYGGYASTRLTGYNSSSEAIYNQTGYLLQDVPQCEYYRIYNARYLYELNLPPTKNMNYLFNNSDDYLYVYPSSFDMQGVESAVQMFGTYSQIDIVNLKNVNSLKTATKMFFSPFITKITGLDLTLVENEDVTEASSPFYRTSNLTDLSLEGSINMSFLRIFDSPLNSDSVKSVLTAASKTTNNNAKTLSFKSGTTVTDTDGTFADLISQCTAKGWTVTNLTIN